MLVLDGSERFVDVVSLAGHTVSQLRIVTAQALVSTHKGMQSSHSIRWLCFAKARVSCHAFKWKRMERTSMIAFDYSQVANNVPD
jgi:hypothetical protein